MKNLKVNQAKNTFKTSLCWKMIGNRKKASFGERKCREKEVEQMNSMPSLYKKGKNKQ